MSEQVSLQVGGVLSGARRAPARAVAGPLLRGPAGWAVPGLLALVASLAWSWHPSLWTDEDATVSAVTRPLPQTLALLSRIDAVHGAYYLVVDGWVRLAGTSPFALRFPSAVATAAAAVAVVLIGRRVGANPLVGPAAGVAFAVLPTVSYYGMEARSVAFGAAGAAWTTWALLRARDGAGRRAWVGYALLLGVSVWFHLYVGLLVVVHAVTLLASRARSRTWGRWLAASVVAVLLASPLVLLARSQSAQVGWLTPVSLRNLPGQAGSLFFEGSLPVAVVAWALAALGVLTGLRAPTPDAGRRAAGRRCGLLAVALPWLVIPFALVFTVSLRIPLYTPRYLFFCVPAVALLIGAGVSSVRSRSWAAVLLAVLLVAGLRVGVAHRRETGKGDDLAAVDRIVAANAQPGDAVLYRPQTRRLAAIGSPGPLRALDDVALARSPAASDTLWGTSVGQAELTRRLGSVRRVWIVDRPGQHAPRGSDVTTVDRALAADGFRQLRRWRTGHSELQLVAAPASPTAG